MQFSELASWIGSIVALFAFLQGVLPQDYRDSVVDMIIRVFSPYTYFLVPEYENASSNELYVYVKCYLSSITSQRARVATLLLPKNAKDVTCSLANNQRIRDTFNNVRVEWVHTTVERRNTVWLSMDSNSDERRSFKVRMPRSKKDYLLKNYLSYIVEKAKEVQRSTRYLQLYSNKKKSYDRGSNWNSTPFLHPANFETIAMDPNLKFSIVNDLEEFIGGEKFYSRVGKAWKRGYLLHGPPGTGKSSVVAAIANKLQYDVYDLELTEVESNAELRHLLLYTSNKSIVVIEDIDCSLDLSGQRKKKRKKASDATLALQNRKPKEKEGSRVTLSGLLNFTDGLWSSSGSERIFIFTTNFIDKLDPALIRAGRMDFHIELGYCEFPAFKMLAANFLMLKKHHLFAEVQREIETSFVTPADIAEVFTKHKYDSDLAMEKVLEALQARKSKPVAKLSDDESDDVIEDEAAKDTKATDDIPKPDSTKSGDS